MMWDWKKINEKKARMDRFRPLPSYTFKDLQAQVSLGLK